MNEYGDDGESNEQALSWELICDLTPQEQQLVNVLHEARPCVGLGDFRGHYLSGIGWC